MKWLLLLECSGVTQCAPPHRRWYPYLGCSEAGLSTPGQEAWPWSHPSSLQILAPQWGSSVGLPGRLGGPCLSSTIFGTNSKLSLHTDRVLQRSQNSTEQLRHSPVPRLSSILTPALPLSSLLTSGTDWVSRSQFSLDLEKLFTLVRMLHPSTGQQSGATPSGKPFLTRSHLPMRGSVALLCFLHRCGVNDCVPGSLFSLPPFWFRASTGTWQ